MQVLGGVQKQAPPNGMEGMAHRLVRSQRPLQRLSVQTQCSWNMLSLSATAASCANAHSQRNTVKARVRMKTYRSEYNRRYAHLFSRRISRVTPAFQSVRSNHANWFLETRRCIVKQHGRDQTTKPCYAIHVRPFSCAVSTRIAARLS